MNTKKQLASHRTWDLLLDRGNKKVGRFAFLILSPPCLPWHLCQPNLDSHPDHHNGHPEKCPPHIVRFSIGCNQRTHLLLLKSDIFFWGKNSENSLYHLQQCCPEEHKQDRTKQVGMTSLKWSCLKAMC